MLHICTYIPTSNVNNGGFGLAPGFVFLLFAREESVHRLLDACEVEDKDFYFYLSSASMKGKRVSAHETVKYKHSFLHTPE